MSDSKGAAIDKVLEDFGSSLYDYITEKDIIKAAEVYAEKPMYKAAKQAILAILAQEVNTDDVTRFEVIDHRTGLGGGVAGRVLVIDPRSPQELPAKVELSVQDDGRTLKVFVSDRKAGLV